MTIKSQGLLRSGLPRVSDLPRCPVCGRRPRPEFLAGTVKHQTYIYCDYLPAKNTPAHEAGVWAHGDTRTEASLAAIRLWKKLAGGGR